MSKGMQDYLTQAAQRLRLSVDAQSGILFGDQGGMNMLLTRRIMFRWSFPCLKAARSPMGRS